MAVSKRTRYEVLRRDNHACRYCGGIAPDVKLTVDHVVPVSLGGSDDPSNLVAACKDCNAGKSSSNPDATLVADVSNDAMRWAAALQVAMSGARDEWASREQYRITFLKAWKRHDKRALILPKTWVPSLNTWHDMGVPVEILCEAVDIAFGQDKVANGDVFRYTAGVVWRRVDKIQDSVTTTTSSQVGGCGHCGDVDDHDCYLSGDDNEPCPHCGDPGCLYQHGVEDTRWYAHEAGRQAGIKEGAEAADFWLRGDRGTRVLTAHIDGRSPRAVEDLRWTA